MTPETILYTDGHEVTVTDSFFRVRKSLYQLDGITKHSLSIIQPDRLTPALVFALGLMMITMGAMELVPTGFMAKINLFSIEITENVIALFLGGGLAIAGAILLGLKRERYAIRIATAEGEKNVVVSPKKEYIRQIQEALNHASFNFDSSSGESTKKRANG